MEKNQLEQIENYNGGRWNVDKDVDVEWLISLAATREEQTIPEIEKRLLAGETICWMGAWDALIRKVKPKIVQKPKPQKPATLCSCGHYSHEVMSTSSGSSCPDCYDRMSD